MEGSTFLIIRGVVSVLFGVLAFVWPGITLAALVIVFGAYALVDGVVNLVLGLTSTPSSPGRSSSPEPARPADAGAAITAHRTGGAVDQ